MTAEPVRDRWGRYVIDGVAYQRVTTLAGMMDDRHALEKWGRRCVAKGLTMRQDILAAVAACPDDDKGRLDDLCESALEAASASAGANLGSALHEMTARIDAGEDFKPLPPWDTDVKAYQTLLDRARITICPEWVEQTVVCPKLNVAGTFDRLVEVRDQLYVADLKTGKSLDHSWRAICIQLAAYANSELVWDWETGTSRPMPDVNTKQGLVFHLPAGSGTASLHVVDLEAGWEAAQMATQVREWRARKGLARPAKIKET